MRPSLIPGLVAAAQKNADRGFPDTALFEVGQIFKGDKPEDQFTAASGVRHGLAKAWGLGRHWSRKSAGADAYDAKGDALAALAAAGAPVQALQISPRCRRIIRRSTPSRRPQNILGHFGELSHPRARGARRRRPAGRLRGILERIPSRAVSQATRAKPVLDLSPFQPVTRDFASWSMAR